MKPRIRLRQAHAFQGLAIRRPQLGVRSLSRAAAEEVADSASGEAHLESGARQEKNAFMRHRDWWNARQKKPGMDPTPIADAPHWAKMRPAKLWCTARLKAALNPFPTEPSSSTPSVPSPDPLEVYSIVQSIYDAKYLELLEPHLADIAHALHLPPSTNWQPAEQRKVALLLAHVWSRASELDTFKRSLAKAGQAPYTPARETDVRRCADCLATYIIREAWAGDPSRANALYEVLKKALEDHRRRKQAFFLPTPLMAALVVSRTKAGITKNFKLDVRWPEVDKAVLYAAGVLHLDPVADSTVVLEESAKQLLAAEKPEIILPAGIHPLRKQLKHFAEMRDYQSRIDTWRAFRNKAVIEGDQTPDTLFDPTIRQYVLGAFLQSLLTPASNRRTGVYSELDKCSAEVLELIPKPYPREVLHTLLARRAGVSQTDATSTDPESNAEDRKMVSLDQRKGVRADLDGLWAESEKSGRDLKMYLIYIEALGRLGSLSQLSKVWNELVNDKKAKEIFLAEEGSDQGKGVYPPTRALNHMMSACLLAPGGSKTADELFEQACRPDSTVPIDIVTINTMLRHHARKNQIAEMTSLFALSQSMKIVPDVVTYTTLLQGLLKAGQFDMARKVIESMSTSGMEPNPRMCSMLVADLAKEGDSRGLEAAEEMLREMRRLKMSIGEVTWTGLIMGYFRGGWVQDAWEAVRRMEAEGVKLNRVGYNLILKQAANDRQKLEEKGESWPVLLYRKMKADGVKPNSDTFVILLDGLCRTERWQEADKIVVEIGKMDFVAEKGSLVSVLKRVRMRRKEAKWDGPRKPKRS